MKIKVSSLICGATLAGIAVFSFGCASTRPVLLDSRGGVVPSPEAMPAKAQTAKPAEIPSGNFIPAEPGQQPQLPAGTQATTEEDGPVFVNAKDGSVAPNDSAKKDEQPAEEPKKEYRKYTVVKGDTLSIIAYRYKLKSWTELAKLNDLNEKSVLKVGQVLLLPEDAAESPRPAPKPKKTSTDNAEKKDSTSSNKNAQPLPEDGIYVVQQGDSLWKIAHKFGIRTSDIEALNPDLDPKRLQIGDKIVLPKKEGADAPAAKPAEEKKAEESPAVSPILPNDGNIETKDAPSTAPTTIAPQAAPVETSPANLSEPAIED